MTTPSRFSFLQVSLVLVAAGVGVVLFPTPRHEAPRWTLVVQDEHGQAVPDLMVTERWSAGFISAKAETEMVHTDAKGSVVFPARDGWSSLLGSVLQTIHAVLTFGTEPPIDATLTMGGPAQDLGLVVQLADPEAAAVQTRVVFKGDGSYVQVPW